jgi:hypothetical protein
MTVHKYWLAAVLAFSTGLSGLARSAQICNLAFSSCPKNLATGTITVPENVIWLDPVVPTCTDTVQVVTGKNSPAPSIVFIIDNSGSMRDTDPEEARFKTTLIMLDSIFKVQPATKVGISIFCRRLVFDHRDNDFFKPAFPADTSQHDSYIPLTALNTVFPNGRTGLDTLKHLLEFDNNGDMTYDTPRPATRTNKEEGLNNNKTDVRNGTDITLGFQGAKQALVGDANAKENQYFIFLSDGDPSSIDDGREAIKNDWVRGTGVPTLFTVFFGNKRSALDSMEQMTSNVIANGYSTNNPKSKLWAINLPASELLTLLQTGVLIPIFANTPSKAVSAVLTVGGTRIDSADVNGTTITFSKRVPLSANQTKVDLTYTYQFTDSGKVKTKPVTYTLNINRAAGTTALPTGLTPSCQDQANITLFNKGNPINIVTADHDDLDVHLTLANGEVCNGCKVEVKPSKSSDKENITLTPASGFQTGNFGRETINIPVPGDGKLQHLPTDSIIITYVNPDNALDVIRKAFPYSDISTVLNVLRHNDYSRGVDLVTAVPGQHFVLVAPASLNPTPEDKDKNWGIVAGLTTPQDSARYVGNIIQASRAFKVEMKIYTNLGQFVNKIEFSVSQTEFAKLAKSAKGKTRQLSVLWDNLSADGTVAGTGAYILKTTVTLLKLPGVAEDEAVSTDYRIVGVLRRK